MTAPFPSASRRALLQSSAAGFGWLAASSLLGTATAAPTNPLQARRPHFPARAKRVIFLFMKGTAQAPQCGFSANVARILDSYNVSYNTFNILSDMEIREGVKSFSNWPTYPQLYIKGQLVGGSDIVMELHQSGELKDLLKQ